MQPESFLRLQDLWSRRQQLTQQEMAEFYQRTVAALVPYRPQNIEKLGEPLADLRHQFFIERVLDSDNTSPLDHRGALFVYFKRFIIDLLRKLRPATDITDPGVQCALSAPDAYAAALGDYGLSVEDVRSAADHFVVDLPRPLILLLRHCGCGDMPVKELAEQIASAQYHGGKLGLVHKKKGQPDSQAQQLVGTAHRATMLGSWVLNLLKLRVGDALNARDIAAAQIILDILCTAALSLHLDPVSTSPNLDERPQA